MGLINSSNSKEERSKLEHCGYLFYSVELFERNCEGLFFFDFCIFDKKRCGKWQTSEAENIFYGGNVRSCGSANKNSSLFIPNSDTLDTSGKKERKGEK